MSHIVRTADTLPVLLSGAVIGIGFFAAASAAPQPAAHPDLSGTWQTAGDFESGEAALPGGGDSVGWAPLSQGTPEYRLEHLPTKEQRFAAEHQAMKRLQAVAGASLDTRLGDQTAIPLPGGTPAGQKAYIELNTNYNVRFHNEHCYAGNIIGGVESGEMAISQKANQILIAYESGFPRVIYTDGRSDSAAFAGMFGYSIGHWEGSTLVVKTTKISGKFIPAGLRSGWPMSKDITLTERYTLGPDRKTMLITRQFEDPTYYTEPMGSALKLQRTNSDLIISPCVEGLADAPTAAQSAKFDEYQSKSPKSGSPK